MKQVLVTGGGGQVGTALAGHVWPAGCEAVALTRAELDLTDPAAIAAKVAERPWAAVINAGAYTAVDKAESEPLLAWQVNALAPAALAAACKAADMPLVHVSTDYVFAGDRDGAWEVDDPVGPTSVYGASKLGGELAVRTGCFRHAIVRTAWVVSATGANFVKTMLRLGADRPTLRVVADQHGSPTSAADLAEALATIAIRLADDPAAPTGTWHFSNAGATTWHGFATEIFRQAAAHGGPSAIVEAIATADFPTSARRPANSLLSTAALTRDWGVVPRPWQEALRPILDDLIGPKP
ncbi:dTDP-4-dehydrorhamnose reductase [Sphingomonas sp.]|jgi:dTDP-4-dehydrorhamnose reductase|uniref:dTDP-4-dehydrorhamnose reductase n=1 Tax=Sphingomonas sp. TaxID=28214 RepID=UPI002D8071CC|nr:dTDP-4-dehydrorhamnose reductase [Sphingomonas sp.]HEU0044505.1 dTDP-4-dehydrorhamnose reductase [Sphingomonas sp.]